MIDFPCSESPIQECNAGGAALLDDYWKTTERTTSKTVSQAGGMSKAAEAVKNKTSSKSDQTESITLGNQTSEKTKAVEERKSDKTAKTSQDSQPKERDSLLELEESNRDLKRQLQEIRRARPFAELGEFEKVVVDTERFIKESREARVREAAKWAEKARVEKEQVISTVEFGIKNFDQLKGGSCYRSKDPTLLTRRDIDVSCGALLQRNPDADVQKYEDLSYMVGKRGRNAAVDSGFPLYLDRGLVKAVSKSDLESYLKMLKSGR